tara:strand:- start:174 stop:353 length:180 start_codon:yes stop_codon:yes gene_type:complete
MDATATLALGSTKTDRDKRECELPPSVTALQGLSHSREQAGTCFHSPESQLHQLLSGVV